MRWVNCGSSRMPPSDSPVEAIDSATERRRWNHLVTTVVVGTRPHMPKPTPKTVITANICGPLRTCASSAMPAVLKAMPAVMTQRTSKRLTQPPV